ncbi:hypothetical protein GWL_09440 [Herbaspirillum sp. GW103]|nr:hypothetical protein GWL_09440 [Herbaspirillum sp. GW103]
MSATGAQSRRPLSQVAAWILVPLFVAACFASRVQVCDTARGPECDCVVRLRDAIANCSGRAALPSCYKVLPVRRTLAFFALPFGTGSSARLRYSAWRRPAPD